MKNNKNIKSFKCKSTDILYLKKRLELLVKEENYEKAAILYRWISELEKQSSN